MLSNKIKNILLGTEELLHHNSP